MSKHYLFFFSLLILLWSSGCNESGNLVDKSKNDSSTSKNQEEETEAAEVEIVKVPADFVPDEFNVFDKIFGDLNNDGQEDCILITKGKDSSRIVQDEYLGRLDRNRRGIIILFKDGNSYKLAVQNENCFSSENEDGGVYFPPELDVYVENGKLYLHYAHGRYGYWKYTFRYQKDEFKLIGYDQADHQGPILHYSYSYNFLSGKKLTKENVNFYSENPDDEKLKETWEDINTGELIGLVSVDDFDDLSFDY